MAQDEAATASRGAPSAHNTGSARDQDQLAVSLAKFARDVAQAGSSSTLDGVVSAAIQLVPGTDEGSISVVIGRREVTSAAPSSDLARQVDALQAETGEGPCLDAVFQQQTVRVADMRLEQRWPSFARRAAEAGAASMLSFQLWVEGDNLGALNLYSRSPDAFTDESEHVGLLFAAHAAVAYASAQKQDQLVQALATRDLIGQAKGILMERYQIAGDQAFSVLVRTSQNANRKLRDVAEDLARELELASRQRS